MDDLSDLTAADRSLLLLDDDGALRSRLGRALEARGFETIQVGSVSDALAAVAERAPAFAVLDMRLEDGSGLAVVDALRESRPDARIIMLTGYGNIATAGEGGGGRLPLQARRRRRRGQRPAGRRDRRAAAAAGEPHERRPRALGTHP